MSQEELSVLARRLEKLEKGNGRLKLALAAALVFGLAVLLLSHAPSGQAQQGVANVVQAQAFQLVDGAGSVLMNISHANGVTKLELKDGRANGPVAGFAVGKNSAEYYAKGAGKNQKGQLILTADQNSAELKLADVQGRKNTVNP